MKNPFGQLIRRLFGLNTPEPASCALMVGVRLGAPEARREDQSDLLRRAMMAASAPEAAPRAIESSVIVEQPPCTGEIERSDAEAEPVSEQSDLAVSADSELEPAEVTHQLTTEMAPEHRDGAEVSEPTPEDVPAAPVEPIEELVADAVEESTAAEFEEVSEALLVAPPLKQDVADLADVGTADLQEPGPEEIFATADISPVEEEMPAVEEEALASADADVEVEEAAPATPAPTRKKAAAKKGPSRARKASGTKSKKKPVEAAEAADDVRPEDDVWVSDAVVWSLSGYWLSGEWSPPAGFDGSQRLEEFRELAAEGKLTIWGRSDDAGVWQPIEAAYWKSCAVEPASLVEGRENVVAEPKAPPKAKGKAKAARKYSALKVSKSQVEELWRAGAMH